MGKARDAYGLVLSRLRLRFEAGEVSPGSSLSIRDLAEEHRTSTTPVREALVRLSGEGLVHEARGQGFTCAGLSQALLEDLYSAHRTQLMLALESRARPGGSLRPSLGELAASAPGSPDIDAYRVTSSAAALQRLADAGVSRVGAQIHQRLLVRLAWARRTELRLFTAARQEVTAIGTALEASDYPSLIEAVQAHLINRVERAESVVAAAGLHGPQIV